MKHPHLVLGVARNAEVGNIKRAYARLVKQHRPDDDPVRFQQVHEAFEAMLHRARAAAQRQAALAAGDADGQDVDAVDAGDVVEHALEAAGSARPAPPPLVPLVPLGRPVPAPPARAPATDPRTFALGPFLDSLGQVADLQGAAALDRWLHVHEELYSLQLKQALVDPLVQWLTQREPPLAPEALEVVLRFFDLDTVSQRHPRAEAHLHWLRDKAARSVDFEKRVTWLRRRDDALGDRLIYDELLEPHKPWRRALILAVPGFSHRIVTLGLKLRELDDELARRRIDPDALAWWSRFHARERIDWRRATLALGQCAAIGMLIAALSLAITGGVIWPLALTYPLLGFFGWGLLATLRMLGARWDARRARKREAAIATAKAAGLPPSPSGPVDLLVKICASLTVVGLACAVATMQPGGDGGVGLWSMTQPLAALLLLMGGRRIRIEALACLVGATVLATRLGMVLGADGNQMDGVFLGAVSAACVLVLGLDQVRARRRKLDAAEARRQFNGVLLGVGLVLFVLGLLVPPP